MRLKMGMEEGYTLASPERTLFSSRCRSVVDVCANCLSTFDIAASKAIVAAVLLKRPMQDLLAELGVVAPHDALGELAHTVSFLRSLDLDPVEVLGSDAIDVASTWTTAPQRKPLAFGWLVPQLRRRRLA